MNKIVSMFMYEKHWFLVSFIFLLVTLIAT